MKKNYQTPLLRVVHIMGQRHLLSASGDGDMSATIPGYGESGGDGDGFTQQPAKGRGVNWNEDWNN